MGSQMKENVKNIKLQTDADLILFKNFRFNLII